jgi:hypothetical protein
MAVTRIGNLWLYNPSRALSTPRERTWYNYAEPVSMADSLHHSNIRHNPFGIHDVSVAASTLVFRLLGNLLSMTQA